MPSLLHCTLSGVCYYTICFQQKTVMLPNQGVNQTVAAPRQSPGQHPSRCCSRVPATCQQFSTTGEGKISCNCNHMSSPSAFEGESKWLCIRSLPTTKNSFTFQTLEKEDAKYLFKQTKHDSRSWPHWLQQHVWWHMGMTVWWFKML